MWGAEYEVGGGWVLMMFYVFWPLDYRLCCEEREREREIVL